MRLRQAAAGLLAAMAVATVVTIATLAFGSKPAAAGAASLGTLNSELGATRTRENSLAASLGAVSQEVSTLSGQIALVQSRAAAVRATLTTDSEQLSAARAAVAAELHHVMRLHALLLRSRADLSAQLVSQYEDAPPNLVSVVLDAHGFNQLLEQLTYLGDAEHQEQTAITVTQADKLAAASAAVKLERLELTDARSAAAAAAEAGALNGMDTLLDARDVALTDARSAQETALGATRAKGAQLQSAIATVEAEQAAIARAAALRAQTADSGVGADSGGAAGSGEALGPSGGWAIPDAIVLCESGGQDLPPNGNGASGYYQIIPSTWALFGGTGPAAYLASKAEQDAVASRIWNGGAGASNWACSSMVSTG